MGVLAALFLVMAIGIVVANIASPMWPYLAGEPLSPTLAAVLATAAGVFLASQRQLADKADARSRFYLEEARKGYDTAFEILKPTIEAADPLLRRKWLAAARVLETARRLAGKITTRSHRDVWVMEIPHQSQRFIPFFTQPAPYYYGISPGVLAGVPEAEVLNEAARRSTAPEGETAHAHREIPEKAIYTVWRSIQYPSRYQEVLSGKFEEGDRLFLPEGLRACLAHRDQVYSAVGVLYPRTTPRDGD
jgi:hypothetical protein